MPKLHSKTLVAQPNVRAAYTQKYVLIIYAGDKETERFILSSMTQTVEAVIITLKKDSQGFRVYDGYHGTKKINLPLDKSSDVIDRAILKFGTSPATLDENNRIIVPKATMIPLIMRHYTNKDVSIQTPVQDVQPKKELNGSVDYNDVMRSRECLNHAKDILGDKLVISVNEKTGKVSLLHSEDD